MAAPMHPPAPGDTIIGYEMFEGEPGCCQCTTLSREGALAVLIAVLLCPCVACVPCCMRSMHDPYQVPVYGKPAPVQQYKTV